MVRLLSDENFNGDIVRGMLLRRPDLDLIRVQDVGLETAETLNFCPGRLRMVRNGPAVGNDTDCYIDTELGGDEETIGESSFKMVILLYEQQRSGHSIWGDI